MLHHRFPLAALLLVCSLPLLALSCTRQPSGPPNIVVILIDTLRADRLGVYGDGRGLTPFLDRLAARGARFANAYAASSWTMPSVASLFTSRYPTQHHVNTLEAKLSDSEVTLAETLVASGYAAAGFTANFHVSKELGYGQGFDPWATFAPTRVGVAKLRGEVLRINSLHWLDARPASTPRPPLLLYYQYMEPHAPYEPPEPFRSRYARQYAPGADARANLKMVQGQLWSMPPDEIALLSSLYDGEVAAVDEEVHRLYTDLDQRHLLDNSVLVITADHGEEFGERGGMGHGFTLFNEQLRVPLIILGPGIAARTIDESVSLIDLAPTLVALARVAPPPSFEGRSLVPLLVGTPASPVDKPVDVVAELEPAGQKTDLRAHNAALVRGSLKLLRSTDVNVPAQIFDLARDPGEKSPNPPDLLAQRDPLFDHLLERELALRLKPEVTPETVKLDDATREKLRALGYQSE